jgi:2-amino-4-hydroxy-6-hydroxymethyldihydropteridine diphosphokinase
VGALVAIGLSSNLGNRLQNLTRACASLQASVQGSAVSSAYETAPLYVTDQPEFLNAVMVGWTELGPIALLAKLKEAEKSLGRIDRGRNGPREIDLDIVAYGSLVLRSDTVVVPHPRAPERRFVLQPLVEIDPGFRIPGFGLAQDLLSRPDVLKQQVRRVSDARILV